MTSRYVFAAIAVLLGIGCIRLGIWQLDRRGQRQARNAAVAARAAMPAVDIAELPADTTTLRFRRARITGVADYDHELILGNRPRDGSPGVNLLTPVRVAGSDTAFLVNRGWVYAPDAATPRSGNWREADSVTYEGYVELFTAGAAMPVNPQRPRSLPRATLASVRARVPYPVADRYLVAQVPADPELASIPARVSPPDINDEGSHFSYAVQWFIFAIIAFAGAGIAMKRR